MVAASHTARLPQCVAAPAIPSVQHTAIASSRGHRDTRRHSPFFGLSLSNAAAHIPPTLLHVSIPSRIASGVAITAKAQQQQQQQQPSKKPGSGSRSTAKIAASPTGRRASNTRAAVQSFQGGNRTDGEASSDEDAMGSGRAEEMRDVLKEVQFVRWFREAWPYIQGHRGSTFVIVVPGDVVANRRVFDSILQDVALLHGLGVRIVLVPGSHVQIDELLLERGVASMFQGAYRVTDREALAAAMEASGRTRVDIEAKLSRGPIIPVLRRHGESERWHEVGISVASGNFVHAKRRGVVGGVDYGATGEVKRVDVARIRSRLDSNCVVLLSNLGFTPAGEVLNCNTYEVATACATGLGADKLVCLLDGAVLDDRGRLIRWMTLQQADVIIRNRATQSYTAADYVKAVAGEEYVRSLGLPGGAQGEGGEGGWGEGGVEGGEGVRRGRGRKGKKWGKRKGERWDADGVAEAEEEGEEEVAASVARWNAQRALYSMSFEAPQESTVSLDQSGSSSLSLSDGVNGGEWKTNSAGEWKGNKGGGWRANKGGNWSQREAWGGNGAAASDYGAGREGGWAVNGARGGSGGGSGGGSSGEERKGLAVGGKERSVHEHGFLSELTAAVYACRGGVRRVHLLNSAVEGTLLLELYTRDGVGTMVSSDLYEGTRAAQVTDMPGIKALLQPLEAAGVLVARGEEQLRRELPYFTVVERDGHIIACAALFPFPSARMAEVAAFAVSPASRGHGRGDNLLAYLEKRAVDMGMEKLFLMTTRTADWFVHRGFGPCDLERLPEEKLKKVDRSRGSKSFLKELDVSDDEDMDSDEEWGDSGLPTDLPKYN